MTKIEMFEPAMCCETGICGPSFDPELIAIAHVFEVMREADHLEVGRYNLAQDPQAFVENGTAIDLIHKNGKKILPVTIVDGEVVKTAAYPTLEEFANYTDISLDQLQAQEA